MSTSLLAQVDPASLDLSGISIATTTASAGNARKGSVYNPVTMAAAAPVYFHQLHNGTYLMLNSRRWHTATPDGGIPGAYTAHSEDTSPSWLMVDGPTGTTSNPPGFSTFIPMNTKVDTAVLTAACSRPPGYFYLLNSVQIGDTTAAVLQHFHVSPSTKAIIIEAEEILPTVTVGDDTVVFDKGLQYDTPYLILWGTDSDGKLYRMRKSWGRVGVSKQKPFKSSDGWSNPTWDYWHGTGYSVDPTEVAQVDALTSAGPVSFAAYRNAQLISVVSAEGAVRSAQVWMNRSGRPWLKMDSLVALGSISDSSYLGGCLQLQPQLGANPLAPGMTATTNVGIPYVVSTVTSGGGHSSLANSWGLLTLAL